jgi:hypothetical protein
MVYRLGERGEAVKYIFNVIFGWNNCSLSNRQPVTVAERSKAYTVFARSEAGIMGSNHIQGVDFGVCVRFSMFVLSCV